MDRVEQVYIRFDENKTKIKAKNKKIQNRNKSIRSKSPAYSRMDLSWINFVSLFADKIIYLILEATTES